MSITLTPSQPAYLPGDVAAVSGSAVADPGDTGRLLLLYPNGSTSVELASFVELDDDTGDLAATQVTFPANTPAASGYKVRFADEIAHTNIDSSAFAIVAAPAMYNGTVANAAILAVTMPGLTAFKAASTATQRAAMGMAALRIDSAMRYQGRKYDPTQTLEFPRVAYGSAMPNQAVPQPWPFSGTEIWDWDDATNAAIVPPKVKVAELLEAESILKGTKRDERLQAIADGVASQAIGSLNESYFKPDGRPKLSLDADRIMRRYELRSGQIL